MILLLLYCDLMTYEGRSINSGTQVIFYTTLTKCIKTTLMLFLNSLCAVQCSVPKTQQVV